MRPLLLCLLLAGCTVHTPVVEPMNVSVPLAVPCETEALSEPDWNAPHLPADVDTATKLKALLADLQLSKGYIEELQAELAACS